MSRRTIEPSPSELVLKGQCSAGDVMWCPNNVGIHSSCGGTRDLYSTRNICLSMNVNEHLTAPSILWPLWITVWIWAVNVRLSSSILLGLFPAYTWEQVNRYPCCPAESTEPYSPLGLAYSQVQTPTLSDVERHLPNSRPVYCDEDYF